MKHTITIILGIVLIITMIYFNFVGLKYITFRESIAFSIGVQLFIVIALIELIKNEGNIK